MAIDLSALQRAHPEWNIVDAIPATDGSGGIWAVGRDGGVFTLDANGNTTGQTSRFFGSYTGLAPENRQGDRYFVGIRSDPNTGGYTLISNREGQTYNFAGDRPLNQQQPVELPAATPAPQFTDADYNQLSTVLKANGLEGLIDDAWSYYKNPQGAAGDTNAVLRYLPTTTVYQQRFPGLKELADRGEAWTPAQWNTYWNNAQDQMAQYGISPEYLTREDIGTLVKGNVSPAELQARIEAAGESAGKADPAVVAKLRERGYTDGDITSFFLDADRAEPLLRRKEKYAKAGIEVAGERGGYSIGEAGAEELFRRGQTAESAGQGFSELAGQHALFANLAGESMAGEEITSQEQIGAQFLSDVTAQQEISTRRSRRRAAFEGGGGASTGGGGKTGLG